jgi:hypothetical protein
VRCYGTNVIKYNDIKNTNCYSIFLLASLRVVLLKKLNYADNLDEVSFAHLRCGAKTISKKANCLHMVKSYFLKIQNKVRYNKIKWTKSK